MSLNEDPEPQREATGLQDMASAVIKEEIIIKEEIVDCGDKVLKLPASSTRTRQRHKVDDADDSRCKICSKTFSMRANMLKHYMTVHEGLKPFPCPHPTCGKRFGQKGSLKLHTRSVHDKEENFVCEFCSKGFCFRQSLAFHVKTVHLKIKDLSCSLCPKKFGLPTHLRVHMRSVHGTSKDYLCQRCGKAFSTQSDLRKHGKKVHEKQADPKARCLICNFQMTCAYNLKRHLKGVHKISDL